MRHLPHEGEVHDLSAPQPRSTTDRALAALVKDAAGEGRLSVGRASALSERAKRRAGRRRHHRVAALSLVSVLGVSTAGMLAVVVASPPPGGGSATIAAAPVDPPVQEVVPMLGYLTNDQVRTVIADAEPMGSAVVTGHDASALQDACGAPVVANAPQTVTSAFESWSSVELKDVISGGADGGRAFTARVDTFDSGEQARAYADAVRTSVATCTPQAGQDAPWNPVISEVFFANALFVSGHSGGRYDMTTVVVSGSRVGTVRAWVSSDDSQEGLERAVMQLADLAYTATQRAAAS